MTIWLSLINCSIVALASVECTLRHLTSPFDLWPLPSFANLLLDPSGQSKSIGQWSRLSLKVQAMSI